MKVFYYGNKEVQCSRHSKGSAVGFKSLTTKQFDKAVKEFEKEQKSKAKK